MRWLKQLAAALLLIALPALGGDSTQGPQSPHPPDIARQADRHAAVSELLARSRLLDHAYFQVPEAIYRHYVLETSRPVMPQPCPAPLIVEAGMYSLSFEKGNINITADVTIRVLSELRQDQLPNWPAFDWHEIRLDEKPIHLPQDKARLPLPIHQPGLYVVKAKATMKSPGERGGLKLPVIPSVRTQLEVTSPKAWSVSVKNGGAMTAPAGAARCLALGRRELIELSYEPLVAMTARPPRYLLSGNVGWNIDAGIQQVTANLAVSIIGQSDRICLRLPTGSEQIKITGPDVRQVTYSGTIATVELAGKVSGRTGLSVSLQLPAQRDLVRMEPIAIEGGHWDGGTLIVTNSAGGVEVLPASATGLRELDIPEIPPAAAAVMRGQLALAYAITGGEYSASLELLRLSDAQVRQSIADLGQYDIFLDADGSILCRARYEVRNRTQQYLRLKLPAGAKVVLARVNEQSRPLTPTGQPDQYLLPLERSLPSVLGLVSFPVEIIYTCKSPPLGQAGQATLPLPAIDLPVAYAWCQAYFPTGYETLNWRGGLRRVEQFTNEKATASLSYGLAAAAEGYTESKRPKPPKPTFIPFAMAMRAPEMSPSAAPAEPEIDTKALLARNYYRAGNDAYNKGQYEQAARALDEVVKLAPNSVEGDNAKRLLANPQMPQAKQDLKSAQEKIAAFEVEKQSAEATKKDRAKAQEYYKEAEEAARAGRTDEAIAKFKGAAKFAPGGKSMGGGGGSGSSNYSMEALKERQLDQNKKLMDDYKQEAASGRYEDALKTVRSLRQSLTLQGADTSELDRDARELAVAAAKAQAAANTPAMQLPRDVPAPYLPQDSEGKPAQKPAGPPAIEQRTYDITDLIANSGHMLEQVSQSGKTSALKQAKQLSYSRMKSVDEIVATLHDALQDGMLAGKIVDANGTLIVSQTPENQKIIEQTLANLRQARGSQVSSVIGLAKAGDGKLAFDAGKSTDNSALRELNQRNREQLSGTYKYTKVAGGGGGSGGGGSSSLAHHPTTRPAEGVALFDLAKKLEQNAGQKVVVNSVNVNVDPAQAAKLGVEFAAGNNGLTWSIIDEAQYRALVEIEGLRPSLPNANPNRTLQETIVGTRAHLANRDSLNVVLTAESANGMEIAGNTIPLPHDSYMVISNGDTLTIVKAGAAQHWTDAPADIGLAEVPQNIDVPRIGQLFRLEKTLLEPSDSTIIRIDYRKGK